MNMTSLKIYETELVEVLEQCILEKNINLMIKILKQCKMTFSRYNEYQEKLKQISKE